MGRGITALGVRLASVSRRNIALPPRREHGVTLIHFCKCLTWHEAHSPQLSDPALTLQSLQVTALEKALLDEGDASRQDPLETGKETILQNSILVVFWEPGAYCVAVPTRVTCRSAQACGNPDAGGPFHPFG